MSSVGVPRRALLATRAAQARSWALFGFFVGIFLRLVAEATFDGNTSGSVTGGILDGAGRVAMWASAVVYVVAHLVRLGVLVIGSVKGFDDRPLPAVGRYARMACQVSCMILVAMWLVAFVLTLSATVWSPPGGDDGPVASVLWYGAAALFAACLAVGFVSVIVWLVAEAVAGYREPRPVKASR